MLLRQIQYYQAVVEENSFTAAGERCHISQSAISQQIQALEAELGVKLLERHRRSFTLTTAGELFYKKSLVLTADLDQLCRDTVRAAHRDHTKLRVGYLKGYTGDELSRAISRFSEAYPDAELTVRDGNHEELFDGLRLGQLDIVLNDQRRVFSDAYVNLVLAESCCCIEIAAHNPLARLDSVEIDDLKNTPCILIASPGQRETEQAFYRDVIGFQGEFVFAETLPEARIMVAANQGVLPVDISEKEPEGSAVLRIVPLLRSGSLIPRRLCAFRRQENSVPELETLEALLWEQFK